MDWLLQVAFGTGASTLLGFLIALIFIGSGRTRSASGSLDEMVRRFPRACVLRAELVAWPGITEDTAETIRFVVGGQSGPSFRDAYGFEALKVAGKGIELERIEADGTTYLRGPDGAGEPVDFWVDGMSQEDALVALDVALRPRGSSERAVAP